MRRDAIYARSIAASDTAAGEVCRFIIRSRERLWDASTWPSPCIPRHSWPTRSRGDCRQEIWRPHSGCESRASLGYKSAKYITRLTVTDKLKTLARASARRGRRRLLLVRGNLTASHPVIRFVGAGRSLDWRSAQAPFFRVHNPGSGYSNPISCGFRRAA